MKSMLSNIEEEKIVEELDYDDNEQANLKFNFDNSMNIEGYS